MSTRVWGDARLLCTDVFKYDSNFLENEEEYKKFKAEVLGEDSDEEEDSGSEDDSEDEAGKELTCDGGSSWLMTQQSRKRRVSKTRRRPISSIFGVLST